MGGIMPLVLFTMYMDDLSSTLSLSALFKLPKICIELSKNTTIILIWAYISIIVLNLCLLNLFIPDMYLNREVVTSIGAFTECDAHDNDDIMPYVKVIYIRATFWLVDLRFTMMRLSFAFFNPS